jgi:hypothetical protein
MGRWKHVARSQDADQLFSAGIQGGCNVAVRIALFAQQRHLFLVEFGILPDGELAGGNISADGVFVFHFYLLKGVMAH